MATMIWWREGLNEEKMVWLDDDLMKEKGESGNVWQRQWIRARLIFFFQFILNKDVRVRVSNLRVHPNPEPDPDTSGLVKFNPDSGFNLFRYGLNPDRIFWVHPGPIRVRVKLPSLSAPALKCSCITYNTSSQFIYAINSRRRLDTKENGSLMCYN